MSKRDYVNLANCHEDCERLFEVERERDELRAERDTWVIVAEILTEYPLIKLSFVHEEYSPGIGNLAAAFSIADAYFESWREEIEGKP